MAVIKTYFWIMMGGALGTAGRYWLSGLVAEKAGETFPLGTLVVNVTGSFLIGVFATLTEPDGRLLVSPTLRQFFIWGICGGYTTFSSFSWQTLALARNGDWLKCGMNIFLSVTLCLIAVFAGFLAGAFLNQTKGR